MENKILLSASIVIYNSDFTFLERTINSFLALKYEKKLFLIDNSPSNILKEKFDNASIEYIHTSKNLGYGAGHNIVLDKISELSTYHLILNPDVWFDSQAVNKLIAVMNSDYEIAVVAPQIRFPNGNEQLSCRRYPSLVELIVRRVKPLKFIFKNTFNKGVYHDIDLSKSFNPDWFHGCFMLFRSRDFLEIEGFDERYFMYMEDTDICKRIDLIGKKKLYYPHEHVIHVLNKESNKKLIPFTYHIKSIFQYFYKWKFAK